jgi:mono/diheme cytochrome c family protein
MSPLALALAVLVASMLIGAATLKAANTQEGSAPVRATSNAIVVGRQLYRRYCGQCHALQQALSAGFGNNTPGVGSNGGPSFNQLRVSYATSVNAVAEPTGGHEKVRTKISPKNLIAVAKYIAKMTIHNPIPAMSTDG